MVDFKLNIPVLLGTSREGRFSEKAAKFVVKEAVSYGFDSALVDPKDFLDGAVTEGMDEEKARQWSGIVEKSNGLLVVTPEYNHGYPGELKMMLDQLYDEYSGKPVGICGVSSGGIGGARAVEQLKQVFVELRMVPMERSVYFSNIENAFDGENIVDNSYKKRVKSLFQDLEKYALVLKGFSEN